MFVHVGALSPHGGKSANLSNKVGGAAGAEANHSASHGGGTILV